MDTVALPAWLDLLSQRDRLIRLDTALDQALVVERCSIREAVCELFRIEVDCFSTSAFLDVSPLLGTEASLRLRTADGGFRPWHGCVADIARLGSDGGLARYRLSLVPWLAFLDLRRNSLIFQDLDAREVIERVFADYPRAHFHFDITQPLRRRPICTQYRETDLAFVRRLLAEEGLAWHFEHADEAETGADHARHRLVIRDSAATPEALPALRFHRVAATEAEDAITEFAHQHQLAPTATTRASWRHASLEAPAAKAEGEAGSDMPTLEVFHADAAGRFADSAEAGRCAELRLAALRLPTQLHAGRGAARLLRPGAAFALRDHPDLDGQRFVPLTVEHLVANNLGSEAPALLDAPECEHGSYRNRFLCLPADTAPVPLPHPRPTAPGPQSARVVGLAEAVLTSNRDHQIRLQFAWQRGPQPLPGGLTDTGSRAHPEGHATLDERSATWVRVAEALAGPNWGSHFVPRIGSEVAVDFLHGDIDQPVVVGQLYNGQHRPPYTAGVDADTNHPGVLSGLQTLGTDGATRQRWLLDDSPGQLRQRLDTEHAESRLELGHLLDQAGPSRGQLRGQGFEASTRAWGRVHADTGLLLSSTARAQARSTQMDAADALAQLAAAIATADRFDTAAAAQTARPLQANPALHALREALSPDHDGKYDGPVGGQDSTRPAPGTRDPGDPVERFAQPHLLMEGPSHIHWASAGPLAAFAGEHLHLTAQQDAQLSAAHTLAIVSGEAASLATDTGPLRVVAANGPVSLQAHTATLQLSAQDALTLTSTDARIDVLAKGRLVLHAGRSRIVLDGANIDIECPGRFSAKSDTQPFAGGTNQASFLPSLPSDTVTLPHWIALQYLDPDSGEPIDEAEYEIHFQGGPTVSGTLDQAGQASHENIDNKPVEKVVYKPRKPKDEAPHPPLEDLLID